MPEPVTIPAPYPGGLLEWAGHRSGGVRRLFYNATGRPAGDLIETPLLGRLRGWAREAAGAQGPFPRILLLVGGPGNGKTEAVEEAIRALERELALDGGLAALLAPRFAPTDGSTVPRLVEVDLGRSLRCPRPLVLTLVQDASVADRALHGRSPASLLVDDLERELAAGESHLYLACVNRGVLDDALILATDHGREPVRALLEAVVRAAGSGLAAPTCWPLARFPEVAVWPMDVESLLAPFATEGQVPAPPPAAQVLAMATAQERWPAEGACPAGDRCPYCHSRTLLAGPRHGSALLQVLRWYELASGKRWSFRDLLSLLSYLLAGASVEGTGGVQGPCEWAARLLELNARGTGRPDATRLAAPFLLMAAQYQHALFAEWPRLGRRGIRAELRELGLEQDGTLLGLHYFLTMDRSASIPGTLRSQLVSVCDLLDPALANPDADVDVSARTKVRLRDLDARFSHGVREGLAMIRRYHSLSPLEVDVLTRLADADERVGAPDVRRRRPATAARMHMLLRDFACRVVRRSLGTGAAVVRDVQVLQDFERVIAGDDQLLYHAARQVEHLLNERNHFVVDLTTTFGEPLPPEARRVVLRTTRQRVRVAAVSEAGRPRSDLRFLSVGSNEGSQAIPLTYELFRSIRELQEGMLGASLPRAVTASLDAVRARLAGRVVRDEEQLDGSEIRIGIRDDVVVREMGRFLVRRGDEQ